MSGTGLAPSPLTCMVQRCSAAAIGHIHGAGGLRERAWVTGGQGTDRLLEWTWLRGTAEGLAGARNHHVNQHHWRGKGVQGQRTPRWHSTHPPSQHRVPGPGTCNSLLTHCGWPCLDARCRAV